MIVFKSATTTEVYTIIHTLSLHDALPIFREELEREQLLLNANIPQNDKVRLLWRGDNRISITPFKPLPEPKSLASIKSEIGQRWPMTGLLDVLQAAALDTGLMDAFETSASRVTL